MTGTEKCLTEQAADARQAIIEDVIKQRIAKLQILSKGYSAPDDVINKFRVDCTIMELEDILMIIGIIG